MNAITDVYSRLCSSLGKPIDEDQLGGGGPRLPGARGKPNTAVLAAPRQPGGAQSSDSTIAASSGIRTASPNPP